LKRWKPWLLILVGGLALPISFAGFDQWYLTWLTFIPLFWAIEGVSRRRAALYGFVYGLLANMVGYYWIPYTIHVFGGFPQYLAWGFDVVLCAYQAIQYCLLAYLINRLLERDYSILWVAPAAMVGLETVFPLLFPIFMANTQHPVPLLMQACDLLGTLGVTAVILLFNASIYLLLRAALAKKKIPWKQAAAGPAALVAIVVYGAIRIPMVEADMEAGSPLRVGIIQANMGITEKWENPREGIRRHREGTREVIAEGAELVVWSEAGFVNGVIRPHREQNLRERVLGGRMDVPMLIGALVRPEGGDGPRHRRITHNSAIMLDADGEITGIYDKTYLLAFGEYLPFGDVFPELYEYSPHSGHMTPGSSLVALPLRHDGQDWDVGALICYEDILPRFTRELMRAASPDLLVNMTNDAWFGDTNEPWIHLALAKFRAVEHRRYLVRATNTGVSGIVDPVGRLIVNGEVFEEERLVGDVRLMDGGETLYRAVGDVLGYAALLLLAFGLWMTRRVWLASPDEPGRKGVTQSAGVMLAVAILDLVTVTLLLIGRPAGWTPPTLHTCLWLASAVGLIAAFVLLRRRDKRGLSFAWVGLAARALVTTQLVAATSAPRMATVALLLGIPLVFAVLAGANLRLWRKRVVAKPEKKSKKKVKPSKPAPDEPKEPQGGGNGDDPDTSKGSDEPASGDDDEGDGDREK